MFTTELPDIHIYILNQVHSARAHTHKITVTCETSLTIREIPICTAGGCGKTQHLQHRKKDGQGKNNFSV